MTNQRTPTAAAIDITFNNQTGSEVRIYWVRPDGHEELYRVLGPGERYVQQSLAAHLWQVRGVEQREPFGVYRAGADSRQTFEIGGAPPDGDRDAGPLDDPDRSLPGANPADKE